MAWNFEYFEDNFIWRNVLKCLWASKNAWLLAYPTRHWESLDCSYSAHQLAPVSWTYLNVPNQSHNGHSLFLCVWKLMEIFSHGIWGGNGQISTQMSGWHGCKKTLVNMSSVVKDMFCENWHGCSDFTILVLIICNNSTCMTVWIWCMLFGYL